MDYKKTALYALAGYVLYVVYQKYVAKPKAPQSQSQLPLPLIHPSCPPGYENPIKTGPEGPNEFTCSKASSKTNECNRQFNQWYSPSYKGATEGVYRSTFVRNCTSSEPCQPGMAKFPQYSGIQTIHPANTQYGPCVDIRNNYENPPENPPSMPQ